MTETTALGLEAGTTRDVKAMYEAYPYPSPAAGSSLIEDVANSIYSLYGNDALEGRRILDAGCGTGHRLVAVARRYPKAHFVGVDMTAASLEVAQALVRKHGLTNVELQRTDLVSFRSEKPFDLVVSIGVIHHLEDPLVGLRALASLLSDEGVLCVWLYHLLGEHQRLLEREALLTMWDPRTGLESGVKLMEQLGLKLETRQYGSTSAQAAAEVSQSSIDVDAYLHPIVNAYRFEQAIEMFRACPHITWATINNINWLGTSKLVDLGEIERGDLRALCQSVDEVFDSPSLRQRFRKLTPLEKLRIMEIRLKPTGFTIVGGRGTSYRALAARVRTNIIPS